MTLYFYRSIDLGERAFSQVFDEVFFLAFDDGFSLAECPLVECSDADESNPLDREWRFLFLALNLASRERTLRTKYYGN